MMERGIIAALAAGLIGLWLYLSFSQTHDAQRETFTARQERDTAEFDRDFATATGALSAAHGVRVTETQKRLDTARQAEVIITEEQAGKTRELQRQTEAELEKNGVKLDTKAERFGQLLDNSQKGKQP